MATRIEIELTSARDDDTWTWRAAGARDRPGRSAGRAAPERGSDASSTRPGPARRPDPRPARAAESPAAPAKPRPKRLAPGRVHRDAVVAALRPEQQAVAEQVLRGGVP